MAEVDADEARTQARQVLDGDRYQQRELPRPFEGALRWVGERIEDISRPVADLLSTPQGIVVTLAVVGGCTALVVARAVRRRNRQAEDVRSARRRTPALDPGRLEAEAEAAEADGDLEAAVRLRFRAGVLRLEAAQVVPHRDDATTGRLVRDVPSASFPALARAFDEVAYGGRRPTTSDVADARRGWPRVLAEVGRGASDVDSTSIRRPTGPVGTVGEP